VKAKWVNHAYRHALAAASASKDTTQVGAALVGSHAEVRLTAFNGPPRGVRDTPDRLERPRKYLFAAHAEANLISFAARVGIPTEGCTVVVTHTPCASCMRTLIQAGVTAIYCGPGTTSMPPEEFEAARGMASEAGVLMSEVKGG
jgi:dCMP deaminase